MMDNFATLCCIGSLVGLFLLAMLPRLLMGGLGGGSSRRGPLFPQADDPDIESRGAFGDPSRGLRPEADDPDIQSRGMFGRSRSPFSGIGLPGRRSGGSTLGRSSGRADSPNVRSRGSFGRSKRS
ncbi:MAG TPA: hypothetical protein VHP83_13875 [Aggregatilineaceae bacterium]|nr:hypothetical protein [Aggregatilineaceae bacterium]